MSNIYIVMCRTKKKIDKYFKNNKIRNKHVIDIKKILEEEKISMSDKASVRFFKVIILNRIRTAIEKEKDIYYIPNFTDPELKMSKIINLKNTILKDTHSTFNLLLFFDEFISTSWLLEAMDEIDVFDNSQIIKDY